MILQKEKKIKDHISLIIDGNRIFRVEKITLREKKHGGKYCKGNGYIILDKDYGKSPELMRNVLEEERKISPLAVIFLILLALGLFAGMLIMIFNVFDKKEQKQNIVIPQNNPVIAAQNIQEKVVKQQKTDIIQEEKTDDEYKKLFDQYNDLETRFSEKMYEYETCNAELQIYKNNNTTNTIVEYKDKIIEKEVERKLTNKEKFENFIGKKVVKLCDEAINQGDDNAEICKTIYSNYLVQ